MKHTPGKWEHRIHDTGKGFDIVSSNGQRIVERWPAGWSDYEKIEMAANARLIAEAPAMLEALIVRYKILQSQIDDAVEDNFGYDPPYGWFDNMLNESNALKKLIERATGEPIEQVLKGASE
jgi:hypothetical protein